MNKVKKLLLTGASGFIGSYFFDHYKEDYQIDTFSFLKDDFDSLHCSDLDTIIHLSALVHQMGGATKEEYEQINVTQTLQLANKAKNSGVKHFVFMSTVKVYGEETENVYKENTPCNPEDEYGKSKLKAENELKKLENEEFKVSIIRTPIVYGHGVKANIKNLVSLIKKVPLLPFKNIHNKRSMVYIGNLCYIINEVIKQNLSGVFLASDNKPLSTSYLVKLIANNLDKKIYLIQIPLFETFLKSIKPSFHKRLYASLAVDNSSTMKCLGIENKYSTEDGIRYMIYGE